MSTAASHEPPRGDDAFLAELSRLEREIANTDQQLARLEDDVRRVLAELVRELSEEDR